VAYPFSALLAPGAAGFATLPDNMVAVIAVQARKNIGRRCLPFT
jgi:hypothetical protein